MKNLVLLLVAGLVVGAIIIGCGTKEPWTPNPQTTLDLAIVSAPDTSTLVPNESDVSFVWKAKGGAGEPLLYSWFLEPDETSYGPDTTLTSITYRDLGDSNAVPYTFHLKVTDVAGTEDSAVVEFTVSAPIASVPDTTAPTVAITQSPAEGSFIAVGTSVAFAWMGEDGSENNDQIMYQYAFPTLADTTAYSYAQTATYTNVQAASPAVFYVRAKDEAGNVSDFDSVTFTIKTASILYVDDYLWLDANGNIDHVKEREQKQFYRDVLEGYAFAEWDIALQGMPDSATVLLFSTILFASDSYLGDASSTWWYDVGAEGGGVLKYYMDNGGHLIAAGAWILYWIYNSNPPVAGDFEFDWLGVDSTLGWDYWGDFTWAVNDGNFPTLPDSMKIDVAKNGDQVDYAEDIFALRDSCAIMYIKGLDIDGAEPYDYGEDVAHIFYPGGGDARSAFIGFDAFSMPLEDIRTTVQLILTEFGE